MWRDAFHTFFFFWFSPEASRWNSPHSTAIQQLTCTTDIHFDPPTTRHLPTYSLLQTKRLLTDTEYINELSLYSKQHLFSELCKEWRREANFCVVSGLSLTARMSNYSTGVNSLRGTSVFHRHRLAYTYCIKELWYARRTKKVKYCTIL